MEEKPKKAQPEFGSESDFFNKNKQLF